MTNIQTTHQCTSDCNNTKDCPLCPHGYTEENFCSECDKITKKVECAGCGEKHLLDTLLENDDFSGATYLEGTENSSHER